MASDMPLRGGVRREAKLGPLASAQRMRRGCGDPGSHSSRPAAATRVAKDFLVHPEHGHLSRKARRAK